MYKRTWHVASSASDGNTPQVTQTSRLRANNMPDKISVLVEARIGCVQHCPLVLRYPLPLLPGDLLQRPAFPTHLRNYTTIDHSRTASEFARVKQLATRWNAPAHWELML